MESAYPLLDSLPPSPWTHAGGRVARRLCRPEAVPACPAPDASSHANASLTVDKYFVQNGGQAVALATLSGAMVVSSVGAVVTAYDRIFESLRLFSYTTFLGVSTSVQFR